MARKKQDRLMKTSRLRLEAFDAAAQTHGWERDQGTGSRVIDAENEYNTTKSALEQRIAYLENMVSKWKGVL